MNINQLLEVTTKVFVNWDKQAKQEANRKVKRKVNILVVAPAEQCVQAMAEKEKSLWMVVSATRMTLP
jgi:hypothetical protein